WGEAHGGRVADFGGLHGGGRRRHGDHGGLKAEESRIILFPLYHSLSLVRGQAELGHKRRRRRKSWVFGVLRLLRFLWPRLVGAGLGRRILTQRREDAEGRRGGVVTQRSRRWHVDWGGAAEADGRTDRIILFLLSRSLSSVRLGRGGGRRRKEKEERE